MNHTTVIDTADALFQALGRALLMGSIGGALYAGFGALTQLPRTDLSSAAAIVAGVSVALLAELCAEMLASPSVEGRRASSVLMLLSIAGMWLLARNLAPFHAALLAMLGSALGAVSVDLAARGSRRAASGMRFLQVAAGAGVGAGLFALWLPHPEQSWLRTYLLTAAGAIPAGALICVALRVRRATRNAG